MFDHVLRQFLSAERRKGCDAHERALEATYVRADATGEKLENFIAQFDLHRARFFQQDGHARLDIRRLKLSGKSPLKAGDQAVFQVGDLRSGPVAGEHDLFMPVEKRVEGVKKLFLRALLAAEKLDVVDQKEIGLAISLSEFDQVTVLDRVDELVDKQFAGEIHHLGILLLLRPDVLAYGLHQMRLAKTDAAVNEQRVVGPRGRLCDCETGGMRYLVIRADHKRFDRVSWIKPEHS